MLYARCSAETAIINLMVFLIHVVLRSGAEIVIFVNTNRYIYIFLRSKHDWMSDAAAKLVIFIQDNMSLNKIGTTESMCLMDYYVCIISFYWSTRITTDFTITFVARPTDLKNILISQTLSISYNC